VLFVIVEMFAKFRECIAELRRRHIFFSRRPEGADQVAKRDGQFALSCHIYEYEYIYLYMTMNIRDIDTFETGNTPAYCVCW
jgi:hypothetical protein